MFHRTIKPTHTKQLKNLHPMVSPAQLLNDAKRQHLLQKIESYSALESSRYTTLCTPLIHNLINHCQALPETLNSYFSSSGGFLDHALNRTEAALDLFRNFIIQEGTELSEEQKLWVYALLSAGILQGIAKLVVDLKVELFDNQGQFLKTWNPLLENMITQGSYYNYTFTDTGELDFRRRLNLLLARMLMPVTGFNLIASNSEVLKVWLALLNEDWQSAGALGAILIRAEAIAIQRYFADFLNTIAGKRGRPARISTFIDNNPDPLPEKEQSLGIEFIQWIKNSLEQGILLLNKAPLLTVPGGLLISVDMFKLFVRQNPEFKNWQAIQSGFLALGLHQDGESGAVLSPMGIALPEKMKVFDATSGKVRTISAVEVIHHMQNDLHTGLSSAGPLASLNHEGIWQQQANVTAPLTLGFNHSG